MKEEIRIFLLSGLLEEYALGLTSPEQNIEVEKYINAYPEVKEAYDKVQVEIENYARQIAVDPPAEVRERVFQTRGDGPNRSTSTAWNWAWAAVVGIMAIALVSLYDYLDEVRQEKSALMAQLASLQQDCEEVRLKNARMAFIGHQKTHSWMLKGNDRIPDIHMLAFWNPEAREGHLMVQHLPKAPEGHCYQLWVDVHGEMLPVAIIQDQQDWVPLQFMEHIESINMTIEKEGGAEHPNVAQLVASVQVDLS